MIGFVIGLNVGILVAFAVAFWFTFAKRSPILTVDPWWLETEDRWASLRPVLIAERAADSGGST